jgi:anti-sigma factor RsiW
MRCEEYKNRLDGYIDAELSPEEMRAVEAHLKTCELCAAEVRLQNRLKRGVRVAGKAHAPSLEFRRRVEAAIAPPKKASKFRLWAPSFATAMAAVLLIAALFGWQQMRPRGDATLAELVDTHVATLASATPVDVVSTDRHTVKPWFQGKVPFTFNLPEFKDTGFTLLGGRMSYIQQQPAAQLLFQVRQHKISVFIQEERSSGVTKQATQNAFTVRSWKNAGLQYWLVTDASPQDAEALEKLLKSST